MSEQIAIIPKDTALQVFTVADGLSPYLSQIRAEIDAFVPNITTKKGREAVASMAFKVAKVKTYLDGVGKELADVQKEIPKKIDAARKHARDTLDAWKDEVRRPLTEWESAEEARVTRIKSVLAELQAVSTDQSVRASELIRERIAEVKAITVTEEAFQEFTAAVASAKDSALAALDGALSDALMREAEAAELLKLRQEAAERAAKEREEKIAREAAERAKAEAEGKAKREAEEVARKAQAEADAAAKRELELKLAAERSEREKAEAQARAERAEREAKEKAEREVRQRQEQEAKEAAAREADKAHRGAINRAALEAFVAGGMSEDAAKLAVSLIAKRAIPNVSIAY